MIRKISVVVIVILLFCISPAFAETCDCGRDNVEIVYTKLIEAELVCRAINTVEKFFSDLGYQKKPSVKIVFQEAVYCKYFANNDPIRVYGHFDVSNMTIYISSWGTDYLHKGSRDCFGLPIDLVFHESVIVHELAYLYTASNTVSKLGPAVYEYIAYVTQIAMLPENYRQEVLEHNSDITGFDYEQQINSILHSGSPHKFGIKSYLHFKNKGPAIFHRIIKGEFDPDKMLDMFNPSSPLDKN